MPATTFHMTDAERRMLDRLQKKYGTVRNTLVQGLRALDKRDRETVQPQSSHRSTDELAGMDASSVSPN